MARWWLSIAVCAGLIALVFLTVTIPPITDLPQQVAQIRLLGEAVSDPGSPYRVQWWHPNKLGYLPLAAGWLVASPLRAGAVGMWLIAVAWVMAIHLTAYRHARGAAAAAVASTFVFNHIAYWGFVSFLAGLPVFLAWHGLLRGGPRATRPRRWRGPLLTLVALLLYSAHVLWLTAGLIWLAADAALARRGWKTAAARLAWASPALLPVAWWYPRFAASGFDSATFWGQSPLDRLQASWLVPSALGNLRGPATGLIALAIAGWLALGLWQARRRLRAPGTVDRALLAAAALFALAALALPGVHRHTIFFASRWLPVAAVLLVLALPAPRLRPVLRRVLAWSLLAALSLATMNAWRAFERQELVGFGPALAALPPSPRLLGLDFVRQSPRLRDYPYYHLFAYGQVLRGGTLNRSFADQASSLVVFRDLPRSYPWTRELDWHPNRLRESDIDHFDHVLVHGAGRHHAVFEADPRLRPASPPAPWRLYAVKGRLPPP